MLWYYYMTKTAMKLVDKMKQTTNILYYSKFHNLYLKKKSFPILCVYDK